jgi:hypothetical protein
MKGSPMKTAARVLAITFLLIFASGAKSFGYEVLCQSLPVSTTANGVLKPIFTCSIPANAVAEGKGLRITTSMHSGSSGTLTAWVVLNGNTAYANSVTASGEEMAFNFIVTNTGGTGSVVSGTTVSNTSVAAFGPAQTGAVTVHWSSAWTLEIEISNGAGQTVVADGDTFVVEILS